jgi:hypothetical protein
MAHFRVLSTYKIFETCQIIFMTTFQEDLVSLYNFKTLFLKKVILKFKILKFALNEKQLQVTLNIWNFSSINLVSNFNDKSNFIHFNPQPQSPLHGISGNGLVFWFKFSNFSFSDALNTFVFISCCFDEIILEIKEINRKSTVDVTRTKKVFFVYKNINCQN